MYVFTYRYTYQKLYTENFDKFLWDLIRKYVILFEFFEIIGDERSLNFYILC